MRFAAKLALWPPCAKAELIFQPLQIKILNNQAAFSFIILQENVRFYDNSLQLFFKIFYKKPSNINNLMTFSRGTNKFLMLSLSAFMIKFFKTLT